MLLRFFRTIGAQILIFIPLIGLLLWMGPIFHGSLSPVLSDTIRMPIFEFLMNAFTGVEFISIAVALVLVMAIAFLLVRLNTKFILINNRTYLPAIIYILITSGIPDIQKLNPSLLSAFAILFVFEKILDSYRFEGLFYDFFTASFVIACASLIYPFIIFFIIILWTGIILIRQFNWREWVFTFLGLLTPLILALSYYYVVHDRASILFEKYTIFYTNTFQYAGYTNETYIFLGILGFLLIITSIFMAQMLTTRKIVSRRAFVLLLWMFLYTLGVFFSIRQVSVEIIYIIAIPISFLFSNFWVYVKSMFWGNLFLWMLLGSIIYAQASYYLFR